MNISPRATAKILETHKRVYELFNVNLCDVEISQDESDALLELTENISVSQPFPPGHYGKSVADQLKNCPYSSHRRNLSRSEAKKSHIWVKALKMIVASTAKLCSQCDAPAKMFSSCTEETLFCFNCAQLRFSCGKVDCLWNRVAFLQCAPNKIKA